VGSPRLRKILLIVVLVASFVGLFPVSILITDPLFTLPFAPRWQCGILLVWPDHVELRLVHSISEVSPPPKNAGYSVNVSPERQAWVMEQAKPSHHYRHADDLSVHRHGGRADRAPRAFYVGGSGRWAASVRVRPVVKSFRVLSKEGPWHA
jgi:hypothetical protein